jgi:hypothetical protein
MPDFLSRAYRTNPKHLTRKLSDWAAQKLWRAPLFEIRGWDALDGIVHVHSIEAPEAAPSSAQVVFLEALGGSTRNHRHSSSLSGMANDWGSRAVNPIANLQQDDQRPRVIQDLRQELGIANESEFGYPGRVRFATDDGRKFECHQLGAG